MDAYFSNEKISDYDLCNTKYSIEVLTKHMHYLNKKVVLCTQELTAQFCVRFILDMELELMLLCMNIFKKFNQGGNYNFCHTI